MAHRLKLIWAFSLSIALAAAGCSSEGPKTESPVDDDAAAAANSLSSPRAPRRRNNPQVTLRTTLGEIIIELDAQRAPRTVTNFLNYAEGGHYNNTIVHHVDAGYVALGGAYTPELAEKPGRYPIPNEAANGRKNLRGTIAMARQLDAIDSSTCQFFINLADNPGLDHRGEGPDEYGFCVFGEVVEGLEVLDKLERIEVHGTAGFDKLPVETVLIESARRLR
ncbi:MAG: peptidylprolyl isomerase [Pirellulales bacterium]